MKINIQGYGSISAAGNSSAAAWSRYVSGEVCWSVEKATGLPVYSIDELPANPEIEEFAIRTTADRSSILALHAAEEAIQEAGWKGKDFSVIVGCSRGPTTRWEEGFQHFTDSGTALPKTSPQTTLGGIGFAIANYFNTTSLATSMSMTCSSGMHAIVHGIALLRSGMAKRVLVGGAEAPITEFTLRQMEALRIYGPVPNTGYACRPLTTPPSGMVVGEGAAFLALSAETEAIGTGFDIGGVSFARESSPTATGISAEGRALERSMETLIKKAGWPDVIVAHAPGTKRGDLAETNAVNTLYATTPDDYCMTSFKWATGHTFGASGPLAITAALEMMKADQYCPLPWRSTPSAPWTLGNILINATGFGGNVASVMVRRSAASRRDA